MYDACWVIFEQQGGWLLADIKPGWTAHLPENERAMFRDALVGLYKTSGVELVRPHIESIWPGRLTSYRIAPGDRLVLWPRDSQAAEIIYPLADRGSIEPTSAADLPEGFAPAAAEDVLFSLRPLPWTVWVEAWQRHAQGASGPPLMRSVRMFPREEQT
jgi:hypothetical protein